MTYEEKTDMFLMYLKGVALQEIADKYGTTRACVQRSLSLIEVRPIVYPAISKWMQENKINSSALGGMCGLSNEGISGVLTGRCSPRKESIDAILKVTGMTYEEAFRIGKLTNVKWRCEIEH